MSSGTEVESSAAGSSDTTLEIKIKTLDSASHSIRVNKDIPIPELKRQLEPLVGVPAAEQRLIYRGRVLKDDQLLSSYRVEDGHTLHLVPRPEGDQSSAQGQTEPGQPGQAGGLPRTQVTASLLVGSFPTNEAMPDFNRIVSAVLGVNPNELGAEQGVHAQRVSGVPNPLFPQVSTDAMTTLSLYLNRMEQMFFNGGLGIPPMPSPTPTATATPAPAAPPPAPAPAVPPVPMNTIPSRPLTSPAALGAVFRRVHSLLTGQAATLFNGLAGQFENEASLTDVAMRGELQAAAVWNGTVLQQLGALLLELGRTTLTLHMGTTPAEAIVNSGPAVFISPSGPNPIMVQPTPFQPLGTLSPRTFPGVPGPRSLNIHIHTSDGQQGRATVPGAGQGNAGEEGVVHQQGIPGTIVQETVMVFQEDTITRNEASAQPQPQAQQPQQPQQPQPQPQPQQPATFTEGTNYNVPMQGPAVAQVAQVLNQLGLGTLRPLAPASSPLSSLLGSTLAQLAPTGVPSQVQSQAPMYLSMQFDSQVQQQQQQPLEQQQPQQQVQQQQLQQQQQQLQQQFQQQFQQQQQQIQQQLRQQFQQEGRGAATAQPAPSQPPPVNHPTSTPAANLTQQQTTTEPETSGSNSQEGRSGQRDARSPNAQPIPPVGLGMSNLRPSLHRNRRPDDSSARRQTAQTQPAQPGAAPSENMIGNLMGQFMRSPAFGSLAQQVMQNMGDGPSVGGGSTQNLDFGRLMQQALPLVTQVLGGGPLGAQNPSSGSSATETQSNVEADYVQENDSSHRQAPSGGDSALQKLEGGDSAEAVLDSVARTAIREADIALSDSEVSELLRSLSTEDYMSLLLRDLNSRTS